MIFLEIYLTRANLKRLTNTQKEQLILLFKDGKTIEFLSEKFECTKLTIVRNLKKNLGEKVIKNLLIIEILKRRVEI